MPTSTHHEALPLQSELLLFCAIAGFGRVGQLLGETLEAALQLSGQVLEALGYTTDAARLRIQSMREARLADLNPEGG